MRTVHQIVENSEFNLNDFDAFWFACYLSYPFFAKHVLGFDVADFHKEWSEICQKFKRVSILAQRGSGKTFWFAGFFVWKAVFNQDKEYLIVSNNLEHSKYILKVVKNLITDNELLKQISPADRSQTWRQTEIKTSTNCTFYIRTYSENIRGIHPDECFCVPKGTRIMTEKGSKKIEEIKKEEKVLTHRNKFEKVKRTFKHTDYKKAYDIYHKDMHLRLTANHPIFVKRGKEFSFIRADKVRKTDKIVLPTNKKYKYARHEGRLLKIDEEMAEILGYWVAEGSLMKDGLRFTFGSHEKEYIERIKYLWKKKFGGMWVDTHHSWATNLGFSRKKVRNLFERLCGKNAHHKKIPIQIKNSPRHIKLIFLNALINGDGHWKKYGSAQFYTVSEKLIDDFVELCKSVGLTTKKKWRKNTKKSFGGEGCFYACLNVKDARIIKHWSKAEIGRKYLKLPITKIIKRESGEVYNLEVNKDNSYIANGMSVHNCDEGQNYEDKSVFWQVISPTVQLKNGRIYVVGTTRNYGDLLMELHNENDEYYSKKYPAIIKDEKGKEKPLWPQKYTLQDKDVFGRASLPKIRREIGEINFEQEFMLNPVSSQTGLFPYEVISRNMDNEITFKEFAEPNKRYVVGMDIAYSKAARGDYSVITVLEIDSERNKTLVYMDRFKGRPPKEQKETLKQVIGRFNPYRVVIDQKGVGEGFLKDLQEEIHTTQVEGKSYNMPEEKNELLKSLRNEFENDRITLPHSRDHPVTYQNVEILKKELEETGWVIKNGKAKIEGLGNHDDTVMALALSNFGTEGSGKVSISLI